ncbi:glycoside hydrolase family 10 protein [Lentiprolixibacter aurantiacus]|uniref:Family 10 glycosylhydrolase n=1 Tax=Lentiprolixibacter aurantiacus TaxID=2993939 RepID=A0AAE3SQC8_9FLAO|nr:family 10 glycosylhydrolase [Lentiprolixibacter aurantiacus]MCX2720392.1 family 10 glycosylhydrolase [Lentiprolixibacter aurantiacus]
MGRFFLLLLLPVFIACSTLKTPVPQPKEEFRGVWVATVANIDWPEHPADPWGKKQADFLKILNFYSKLQFNAVFVQVRTAGDALYATRLAPWSRYLTGKEGDPGDLVTDPLKWMIDETHKRGMEFHAWFNPYRATFDMKTELLDTTHDFYKFPEWMVKYGKKYYYNPGLPEVREHLVNIVREVVARYPVDGVHFDDYFYPYRIQGEVFEDSIAYENYAIEDQSLEDWRRSNISMLVRDTHAAIKELKPWVQFGISPFGVWRNASQDPRGSDTRAGQTNFDDLFADPLEWSRNGWVDYLAPQLYWSLDYAPAAHRKLLSWWSGAVPETPLLIGSGAYKIGNNPDEAWSNKTELPEQLILGRKTSNIKGNIFFSARSLMRKNTDVVRILRNQIYNKPVFPPPLEQTVESSLKRPGIVLKETRDYLYFTLTDTELRYQFVEIRSPGVTGTGKKKRYRGKKIYLGELSSFRVPARDLRGMKNLELVFTDKFRQKTKPLKINRK